MHNSKRNISSQILSKQNTPGVTTTSKTLKLATFATFDQEPLNKVLAVIIASVHVLQTFCLSLEAAFYSFLKYGSPIEDFVKTTQDFFIARNVIDFDNFDALQITVLTLIMIYLLCNTSIIIFSLQRFFHMKPIPNWVLKHWKNLGNIHLYCLFLPIHNILTELLAIAHNSGLSTGTIIGIMIPGIIMEVLNIVFYLLQLHVTINIKTRDPLATLDNSFLKVDFAKNIIISVLGLLIVHLKVFTITPLVLNLINVGLVAYFAFIFLQRLPFFSKIILGIFMFEIGVILCSSVISFILSIFYASGFKIDISFALIVIFLIIPVYVKSALNFISRRMEKTLTQSFEYFSHRSSRLGFNKYWFIHAIYHLRSILKAKMRPNYLSKEFSSKKLVQFGHIKFLKSLLFKKEGHLSHINTDDQNMRVFIVKFMEVWLKKRADDNLAKLVLADLLISDFGVMYGPYVLIEQIFKKSHTLSHKISAMRIRESIQGAISSHNAGANFKLDLTLFFEGSQMLDKLKQKITEQIEESYKFHYRILDRNPDLNSIIRSAEKIRTLKKDVKDIWSSIPERLLESYTPLSLAYGIYKYSTNYEYTEGREVLQKFRNILKKQAHYRNNSAINEDTVTSENNVSFLIGTSKTNLGSIVYCSANTKKFFGETAQNLTGKNITLIMPPFFQTIHDSLIMKKLESPDNLLKLKYFPTFGMDKQGYVFPVNLLINLFPWINRGFYFSGIVRPIKDRLNYILLDDQGYINSYSKPLRHKLNLPPSIHNEKINIIHLCMSFDTINQALNQCSRTMINKNESTYGFDLEGLWRIDSTNRTHENETEFRTREDESNLGSPDPMSSPQISSPSRPRGKSKFSFAATSNQIIRDAEMEALATEMMVKGRVLHFRAFNYDQFADTLKSLKSYKGTIFSDHPGPAVPISKGTIASVVTEVSSFSHAITRKQAYFHCRVDIKKYLGRTLKVVILDEVTTVPNDDNTVINQRTLIQNKRYSFRRQLLPLINKKQNNPRSQSPPLSTSPPPNNFSPLYDDPQQPTSLATSPPLKLQEIGELSYEDLAVETEEAVGRGLIDARDFERGRRNGLQRMKDKGGSEDYSSSGASRSASPSNVDSSGNINTNSNESVPLSPHRVDNNPLKIERPRRLTADPDKSSKSSRDLLSVNYMSSNNDPLRKRGSETYSNSKLDFDIANPQSSQGNGSSNIGIDSLKSNAQGGLKFQQKHKAIELAEYLPTMKFYKFHQAKIPFLWLVLCLVALVVCNAVIFTIATDTIPVVQESVGLMRSAINRIMTLVAIFRQTTNLKHFVLNSRPYKEQAQAALHSLGSDLDNYNMDVSEKVNLISANFSSYMFTENIKLYTTDFGNYSSPNNFMTANSFQSVTLMSGHTLRASQATDYTDNTFLYSLEFIVQNALNDLLIKLVEEPSLITGEVQGIIDQTTTYSLTVFIITGVIFVAGGIFLVAIKLKSLFDAKEFLGFFTSYSHKDISPLLEKMDWLKQLLGSMMHDDLLLKHFKASDCFFTTYKYQRDKTKIPRTRKYLLRILWRIIVKLILLLVPIIIVLNLNDRFSTSFQSVSPIFLEVVAAKNVIMSTDLVFAATLYSIIFPGDNVQVNNYPISPIVSAGIELLDDVVLNMSNVAHLETYTLYHMDFCQFVSTSDYNSCENIYQGISTSGLIGSVLSIRSFLRSYKLAFDTNNSTQIAYVYSQLLIPDTDILISFMKEAVETKEEERVDYLMQILKDCQTSIITLTVVSLIVSVLLGIIAGWQVYLPSKRERESICEILLLFPSNMIMKNKRLRPFLTRDSPAFTELFKMQNY